MKQQIDIEDLKLLIENVRNQSGVFIVGRFSAMIILDRHIGNTPEKALPQELVRVYFRDEDGNRCYVSLERTGLNNIFWDNELHTLFFPENGDNDKLFEIELFIPLNVFNAHVEE